MAGIVDLEYDRIALNIREVETVGATALNLNYCCLCSLPHAAIADSVYCREHIQKLHLKGNTITRISCDQLKLLKNLKELYLHSNSLSYLPPDITQLEYLETLNVSCNLLTTLPTSIGRMAKLKNLVLNQNNISYLPPEVWNAPSLESVSAANNDLSSLSSSIINCQSLQTLVLDGNKLRELPLQLTRLENLSYLSVCGNNLSVLPSDFSAMQKLEVVYVDGNRNICSVPVSLTRINSIGLQGCNVQFSKHLEMKVNEEAGGKGGGGGVIRIRAPLKPMPSLMELTAKSLNQSLSRLSSQLPWCLLDLFPYLPTSLGPWLTPRGRCASPSCTQPAIFTHCYTYLISGADLHRIASSLSFTPSHHLSRDISVSLHFCSLHCVKNVL